MLRWGILGTGSFAGRLLAPALRAAGHDLAVVAGRSLGHAQAFAARQGVRRARTSFADVLGADDVDAVAVALPNDLHEEWAVAALQAGKHVLCAPPLATGAAAAGRMAAASAATGRVLLEALPVRFHPRTDALLDLLADARLGHVRLVAAAVTYPLAAPMSYRTRPEHGGGALLDIGAGAVTCSRWVVGEEPDEVRALQRSLASGADATSAVLLGFPSGAIANVHASLVAARHEVLDVVGTEGTVHLPRPFNAGRNDEALLLQDGQVAGRWRADPYERMVTAFAEAVAGRRALPVPIDDAVATAAVLDRVRATLLPA